MRTINAWHALLIDQENFNQMFTFKEGECDVHTAMVKDYIRQIKVDTIRGCAAFSDKCEITSYASALMRGYADHLAAGGKEQEVNDNCIPDAIKKAEETMKRMRKKEQQAKVPEKKAPEPRDPGAKPPLIQS